jgi:hypothetical protein
MISLIFKARANPCANLRVHYRNEYLSILVLGGIVENHLSNFNNPSFLFIWLFVMILFGGW